MQGVKKLLDRCGLCIVSIYRYAVSWIFFAILLYLYFLSTISTTILVRDDEGGHFFIYDKSVLSFLLILCIILIGYIFKDNRAVKKFLTRIKTDDVYFRKLRFKMLVVMGIVSVFWVLSSQFIPGADQIRITLGAYELQLEDYSRYEPGEYFERYQNQYGLLLLTYFFSFFFGSSNYIVFSLFNVAALLFFYYELSELCGKFEFGRTAQLSVILLGFAFYPLIIYTNYIYGTLLGLAFGVAAMNMEMKFFQSKKPLYAVLCAFFIMFSVTIKSNYLIFLVAVAICAVIEIIRNRKTIFFILPLLVAAASIISSWVPKAIASQIVGDPLDGGASSWGWIAMGLQEGPRAPGAFNDYNIQLYRDVCNCDPQLHAELAKENISERMKEFAQDKKYAVSFFTKKQAYQWGDPTFQYAWNIRGRQSQMQMSDWVQAFKSPRGANVSLYFLDPLMTAIFFGALLFCLLCRNKTNIYSLILPMTFVGGFVFHTFWEAAPRYTLPYFVLLFPFTVAGYFKLVDLITQKKRSSISKLNSTPSGKKQIKSFVFSAVPYVVIALTFFCLVGIFSIGINGSLTNGGQAYSQWLETNKPKNYVKEGSYNLCTLSENGISLAQPVQEDSENAEVKLSETPTAVRVAYYQGVYWLKFTDEHMDMCVTDKSKEDHQTVKAVKYTPDNTTNQWSLKETNGEGYNILYNNKYALTYDEKDGSIYVSRLNGKQNQVWYFEKQKSGR